VNDRQRERLLDRIRRPSSAVGAEMTDEITVDLTALLFERERLEAALRRERLDRKQRIARDEVDYEEAEQLVEGIRGIDRALTALEGLDESDIGEERRQKRLEDARELLALVERRP
jgi:hypothetical protein